MAIPRFSPRLLVSGAVREVTERTFQNRETGELEYKGRKVILQTARGFVEVNLSPDQAVVQPQPDAEVVWWVELSEWSMNGRGGSTLAYSAPVSSADLDALAAAA